MYFHSVFRNAEVLLKALYHSFKSLHDLEVLCISTFRELILEFYDKWTVFTESHLTS